MSNLKPVKMLLRRNNFTRTNSTTRTLLRRFSSDSSLVDSPLPSQSPEEEPKSKKPNWVVANELLSQLQTNEEDWNHQQLQRLVSSIKPSSRLVQVIRRLGNIAKALKFLELVQKTDPSLSNSISSQAYHTIFNIASCESNSLDKLSEVLSKSKAQNVSLSVDSACLLIRRFGRFGRIHESIRAFNDVAAGIKDTHLCNTLLDVLLRGDRIKDARELFDEMCESNSNFPPNDSTGSIVFSALLKRDFPGRVLSGGEVIELVSKLGEHHVFPNSMQLTKLITKLCRNGYTNQAWEVLHGLMRVNCPVEAASCNTLLAGLGRDLDLKRMNLLLAEMKEMEIKPNVVTFGILIHHLCKMHRVDEALQVLERMTVVGDKEGFSVEPDLITFNTIVFGLCKMGRQEEGLAMLERMKSQPGCAPNTVTYNSLIDGFSKAGELDKSIELFCKMKEEGVSPNEITLNILVDGMCKHGRISSALEFFNAMKKEGLKGNAITYTAFISAFCNVNNINKALELFNEMIGSRCAPDAKVYYALISGLCQARRMDDACSVAEKIKNAGFRLDAVGYNILINGLCKSMKLDKVNELLKEMEGAGVQPDEVTYNTLISTFSKSGHLSGAHQVMKHMTSNGIVPTVVTYGALIHGHCTAGDLDEAMKIFREMGTNSKVLPNTVIYNILIQSHCEKDNVESAISLMDEMQEKGVIPSIITYNTMFNGLRERNWLDKAFQLMDDMTKQACNPDYITMEVLTEWLSAVGETERLRRFLQGEEVACSL
ncbi:hypothetical protein Sjap_020999 [Stephania japonica]|uniref:Pentatricopeptide repeat-containing protein n=1 Tax=Stephania japonica TaxID=461633 RepID=A0AAP0F4G2_9MAGN